VVLGAASGCAGDSSSSGGTGGSAGTAPVEMPDNLAGDYLVDLTSGENTCMTMDDSWMTGTVTKDVEFVITQNGVKVQAAPQGLPAIGVLALTGAIEFTGEIHGSHFELTNHGTKPYTFGTCSYTINAVVEGDLDGDVITGTLKYEPVIGENPACDDYECSAVQLFSGSRPPS